MEAVPKTVFRIGFRSVPKDSAQENRGQEDSAQEDSVYPLAADDGGG